MLDPWIIEEILKQEERRREEQARIQLELPVPEEIPGRSQPKEAERGVTTIDI